MQKIQNIAVIGAGGVGGFFSGLLMESNRYNVSLIARGKHLEAIKANGLTLKHLERGILNHKPVLATDNFSLLHSPHLVLVTVKGYDLDTVSDKLSEIVTEDTIILPLLNGVDIYERMKSRIKNATILPACVYISSHIEKPGTVEHIGGKGLIVFGNDPDKPNFGNRSVIEVFKNSGIPFQWQEDPFPAIWTKYIFIASFSLVSAYSGKTLGEIRKNETLNNLVRDIAGEIVTIAEKRGIKLPESIIEDTLKKADTFPPDTKTSYQRDIEIEGKPNEGDIFGGTIIRMGKQLNIPTPVTEKIYYRKSG